VRNRFFLVILFLWLMPVALSAQAVSPEDQKRFEEIKARHNCGL
jgi:hypothetical protein